MATTRVAMALSVRQPWAELILSGKKQYELRSRRTNHRGFIWIHASLKVEEGPAYLAKLSPSQLRTGAVLGGARIVDCVPFTPAIAAEMTERGAYFDAWQPGLFAWRLVDPCRLEKPFPYKGKLGMFPVEGLPADATCQSQ